MSPVNPPQQDVSESYEPSPLEKRNTIIHAVSLVFFIMIVASVIGFVYFLSR